MDTSSGHPQIHPDEARAALAQATSRRLGSDRDRRLYAAGLAGTGIIVGGYVTLSRALTHSVSDWVMVPLYVLLLLALTVGPKKAATSVPRGATRTGQVALVVMLVVSFVAVAALNWQGQTQDPALLVVVACGIAIAAPMLVAAGLVLRRRG